MADFSLLISVCLCCDRLAQPSEVGWMEGAEVSAIFSRSREWETKEFGPTGRKIKRLKELYCKKWTP